ncbi:ComEA family DNA-binding protein [Zooshikella ganghwensis]|uniref:ComEA family DNA-binding protein n=1 Tax=Zooshikella ganghwensis TaxID=202772 RepID=UPI00041ACDF5|nr:ComEA family DNA-binding protein [Zooshikella ganghwensis]
MKKIFMALCMVFTLVVAPFSFANEEAAALQAININTATAEQIADALVGIGPAKAQAIVEYREEFGAFDSLDDVEQVKGVGKKTLEKNQGKIEF